jgi:hypothetical protein
MWPRVVEVMIGCWLAMSPFIFRHSPSEPALWWNDFACAVAVVTFGLLSYYRPLQHAHLLQLLIGFWLIGFAFVRAGETVPPALQNSVLVGLFLLMFGVIPNHASQPPEQWEQFGEGDASSEQTPRPQSR